MNIHRAYDLACIVIGVPVFAVLVTRDPWGGVVLLAVLCVLGTCLSLKRPERRVHRAAVRPVQVRPSETAAGASVAGGVNFTRRTGRRGHNGGSRI